VDTIIDGQWVDGEKGRGGNVGLYSRYGLGGHSLMVNPWPAIAHQ
jgi:hypothetical protein